MKGSTLMGGMLGFTAVFAGTLWYFQNHAFYELVELADPVVVQISAIKPQVSNENDAEIITPSVSADPDVTASADTLTTPTEESDAEVKTASTQEPAVAVASLSQKVSIKMTRVTDYMAEVILAEDFEGIDAETSPLKFKACFQAVNSIPMMTETYVVYDDPTPLKGPPWFRCYRHKKITAALESGEAIAFLGEANVTYGVDRVVAVDSDGRGFVWHQINECGHAAFAGEGLPEGCSPKPER